MSVIKGRFNVVGDAIDGIGATDKTNGREIHQEAPKFEDLSTATEACSPGLRSSI